MIGQENRVVVAAAHFISVFFARQGGGGKAIANFHALGRVNTHHRGGQICIQLAVDRRA